MCLFIDEGDDLAVAGEATGRSAHTGTDLPGCQLPYFFGWQRSGV